MTEPPPKYHPRLSLPPGQMLAIKFLTADYFDDKPSISLNGLTANAVGDVSSPPRGRGVVEADLLNLDVRRRFGIFGSTFVELERLRQSRSPDRPETKVRADTEKKLCPPLSRQEKSCERCYVTPEFLRMYKVRLA